jgi:hypothetical protein
MKFRAIACLLLPLIAACKKSESPPPAPAAVEAPRPAPFARCEAEKFTPAEKDALVLIEKVSTAEEMCKLLTNAYPTIDVLYDSGCSTTAGGGSSMVNFAPMKTQLSSDPRQNADYDFQLKVAPEKAEIVLTPKRAGAAAFYSDIGHVYCNAAGPASDRPEALLGTPHELFDARSKKK